jgi:hypothetical protein
MDDPTGTIHTASEHGTVASHPDQSTQPLLVAPTTASEFNTLGLDIVPVACLALHDVVFDFDSSFPTPDVANILKELPGLRDNHKNAKQQLPPLSIFGHADPVGGDIYNKPLSGRRARAIYGLLTHDVDVWERLYNEEWSNQNALKIMRDATGKSAGTSRKELMPAYMALLFPGKLAKADFLGLGADPKGKADFQGCSDFNLLVVLSKDENQSMPHEQRNQDNRPNRRVVVYLFRPGQKISTALWPCPAAEDKSITACRARFFGPPKTGDDRRQAGSDRREFAKTKDTFACRFYSRIAHLSPCEQPAPAGDFLQLLDELDDPLADRQVRCKLSNGKEVVMTTDKDGFLRVSGSLILQIEIDDLHKLA